MGRAIDMEKDIDMLKNKVERLEKAFDWLASTVESIETVSSKKENISFDEPKTKKKKPKEKVWYISTKNQRLF